jgi:hypothetical protein
LLKEAIVGIIRIASAGALVDVGINIYAAEMTSSYGRGANHLVYSSPSLGSGTASSLQLVSTGDITNQNIFLKLQLASNPGWGGWWIGVELTGVNAGSYFNGWRIVNAPTTGLKFGMYTSSSGFFSITRASQFLVNVDGSLTSSQIPRHLIPQQQNLQHQNLQHQNLQHKPTTQNPTKKPTTVTTTKKLL